MLYTCIVRLGCLHFRMKTCWNILSAFSVTFLAIEYRFVQYKFSVSRREKLCPFCNDTRAEQQQSVLQCHKREQLTLLRIKECANPKHLGGGGEETARHFFCHHEPGARMLGYCLYTHAHTHTHTHTRASSRTDRAGGHTNCPGKKLAGDNKFSSTEGKRERERRRKNWRSLSLWSAQTTENMDE